MRRPDRTPRWPRLLFASVVVITASCTQDDPGIGPGEVPATTSDTLPRCPDGRPDATTPVAGCLDQDGRVVRP